MGLLPVPLKCGLRMRQESRDRFPRHRLQRKPLVSDLGMHHGTCVTHVPWCMFGSRTHGDWGKRSRHSRRMRNPQFYLSGKRPNGTWQRVSELDSHYLMAIRTCPVPRHCQNDIDLLSNGHRVTISVNLNRRLLNAKYKMPCLGTDELSGMLWTIFTIDCIVLLHYTIFLLVSHTHTYTYIYIYLDR